MATHPYKTLNSIEDEITYGAEWPGANAKDIIMDQAVKDAQWDPKTGKWFAIMEDGQWMWLPVDDSGNFLPPLPDYRGTKDDGN